MPVVSPNPRDVGLSFMPGIYLNADYMLYGKLGAQTTHIKFPDSYKTGANVGIGIEAALTDTLDLRAEYLYFSHGIVDRFFKLRANNYTLSMVYKINSV